VYVIGSYMFWHCSNVHECCSPLDKSRKDIGKKKLSSGSTRCEALSLYHNHADVCHNILTFYR